MNDYGAGEPQPDFDLLEGETFWEFAERLVATCRLVIDRRRGSAHPRYPEMIYPLDYGYLDGTQSMDGGGIDVWVGSLPERRLEAIAVTVDLLKRDAEIKLLLGCDEDDLRTVIQHMNGYSMRAYLVRRGGDLAWLHSRRSVRRFLPKPVPTDMIENILQAGIQAPSAHNRQPWRFAVVTSPPGKSRLAEAMGAEFLQAQLADDVSPAEAAAQVERSRQRIVQAPVAIVLCLDPSEGDTYPDPARQQTEWVMGVQSVALAGENMLLAAHVQGLGGVWVCAPLFAPQVVRQALDLPDEWQPQGLLLLGYPARIPEPRPRIALEKVTRFV